MVTTSDSFIGDGKVTTDVGWHDVGHTVAVIRLLPPGFVSAGCSLRSYLNSSKLSRGRSYKDNLPDGISAGGPQKSR
jgi:hypothetical protein